MSDTTFREQAILNRVYDNTDKALRVKLTNLTNLDTRYLKLTGGTLTGALAITPLTNSTTTFRVNQADGTNVLTVDTTNGRMGIGTPQMLLVLVVLYQPLMLGRLLPIPLL